MDIRRLTNRVTKVSINVGLLILACLIGLWFRNFLFPNPTPESTKKTLSKETSLKIKVGESLEKIGEKIQEEKNLLKKKQKENNRHHERMTQYILTSNRRVTRDDAQKIVQAVVKEGDAVITAPLLLAQLYVESRFEKNAKSHQGAFGVAQIIHDKWTWYKHYRRLIPQEGDLEDIELSVKAQKMILSKFLEWRAGDMKKALTGYSGRAQNYAQKVYRQEKHILKQLDL